ncbi:MAG TPA: bile acid:sodium symporter [Acidobacteriaceae bacterium]|nr:bile acid:sodium symporter [Acidobacteriaceae bacterium]
MTLEQLITGVSQMASLAFAVSTMLAMGMGLTLRQVITPLRNVRFIIAALFLNFIIVPAFAWLLAEVLGLAPDIRIGLLLIACVAGAPMVPKLVQIAKGDAATAVALVALLIAVTVVFVPLALPLLLPGVTIDSGSIATQLALQMLLPLAIGIFIRERWDEEAAEYRPTVATVSNVALVVLFLTSIATNLPGVLGLFGSGGIISVVLLVAVAVLCGYLTGIPAGVERRVLALGAGQRNQAAAFIIGAGNFADRPTVLLLVGVASLVMMVILFPLAGEWSKRPSSLAGTEGREVASATPRAVR